MLELEKEYTIITICDKKILVNIQITYKRFIELVMKGNWQEDLCLDDFMDYLIVNKLIITNWHILPNAEIMIVYVRKEKGED